MIMMIAMSVKIHERSDKDWKGVMVIVGGFEEDYWLPAALWISASHPLNLVCVNSFGFPNIFSSQCCKASRIRGVHSFFSKLFVCILSSHGQSLVFIASFHICLCLLSISSCKLISTCSLNLHFLACFHFLAFTCIANLCCKKQWNCMHDDDSDCDDVEFGD